MKIKIFGIEWEVTFLFVALIAFVVCLKVPSNVLITIVFSVCHEMGHLFFMVMLKNKPQMVRFELTGVNIKRIESVNISLKNELLIALGGPFVNLIFFLICCAVLSFNENETTLTVACVNLILMTFNILPVKRLDGGTALYFLLLQKFGTEIAQRVLRITSTVFITMIYAWGVYTLVVSKFNISLIIIAIFLTLSMFAGDEY